VGWRVTSLRQVGSNVVRFCLKNKPEAKELGIVQVVKPSDSMKVTGSEGLCSVPLVKIVLKLIPEHVKRLMQVIKRIIQKKQINSNFTNFIF
jgi:hypothetical protein